MASDGFKVQGSAIPPRTIHIQKFAESRASELEALHSIVANRLNNDFRSQRNKRRRTTGHDNRIAKNRYRKKRKVEAMGLSGNKALDKDNKKVSRRVRRRVELTKNPETGFCMSGDGTRRLRTHLWHAKRFTMTKLWGFHLPLGLQGRGRGSRALLKWLKNGVLVHDASYYCAVQLEGPEDMLLSVLDTVLDPPPSAHSEDFSSNVLSGAIHGSAVLHHVGVPFSHSICPVNYMWRPLYQKCTIKKHKIEGLCEPQGTDSSSPFREVWVWLHAAASKEGYDVLKSACQRQADMTGFSINCISLEGQLAKLEVMGSKAFQLLRKILHPFTCVSKDSWELKTCSFTDSDGETQVKSSSFPQNEDQMASSAMISVTVHDPRALTENEVAVVSGETSLKEDEIRDHNLTDRYNDLSSSSYSKPEGSSDISSLFNLWDASTVICPPVTESILCQKKHQQRMTSFCLGLKNQGTLNASIEGQCSRMCPILLLKNDYQKGSVISWSIILPLCWVKAFWIPLILKGAKAIGLREKHWIASQVGLPYFPSDFPDCKAYSNFMETQETASDQTAKLRPPSMRPLRVPTAPTWDCIQLDFGKKSRESGEAQSNIHELCASDMAIDDSLTPPCDDNCEKTELSGLGVTFQGFVARRASIFAQFLNEINGDNLLLFPKGQKGFSKLMKDEGMFSPIKNVVSSLNCGKRSCFLRVLLHAYKEGVFEGGAVVCAPLLTDVTLWTSSANKNDGGLQIPESLLRSYFVQQASGKWELQVPDDPIARESHRWPIGFVTSGFVRGSKKPVAVALCNAVLLARVREEQWKAVPVKRRKKEIYVLVRNLKSTAYRLAMATIVLEQQEEDVEYV